MMKHLFGSLSLMFALVMPMLAQAPASTSRTPGTIIVSRVRGEVFAKNTVDGTIAALHDGDKISEHFLVTTSKTGTVILMFSNGATVSMNEDSILDIQEFQQDPFSGPINLKDLKKEPSTSVTKLNMTRGELVGKVAHLNIDGGSEFTIATPVGAAGIRGTTFDLTFVPDGNGNATFKLMTADGTVLFSSTTSLPVSTGQQISVVVQVNDKTGAATATSTLPASTVTTPISTADLAAIAAAAQTIITTQTSSNITITSSTNGTTASGTTSGTNVSTSSGSSTPPSTPPVTPDVTPPLPPAPLPRTTNGDGT
jgi:hypothetical protein